MTIEEIISGKCRDPNVPSKVTIYDYLTNTSRLVPLSDVEKLEYGSFAYVYTTDSPNEGFVCVFDSNTKDYKVYPAVKINLRTVDQKGTPVSGVGVYRRLSDNPIEIEMILVEKAMIFLVPEIAGIKTDVIFTAKGLYEILNGPQDPQTKAVAIIKMLIKVSGLEAVKKFVEAEYTLVGKTNNEGYVDVWVISDQETNVIASGPFPDKVFRKPDHSIQNILNELPWTGKKTVKTSLAGTTENVYLKKGANVLILTGKDDAYAYENLIAHEVGKFLKEGNFGGVEVEVNYITIRDFDNMLGSLRDDLLKRTDIFIYVIMEKNADTTSVLQLFMPTLEGNAIVDKSGSKYTDNDNGLVSYKIAIEKNNYLIAGVGKKGLKDAIEAFKGGSWETIVGPPPKTEQKGNVLDKIKDFIDRLFRRK